MPYIMRWAGLLSLLLLATTPAFAQESASISLIGSGIVNALVQDLADAGEQGMLELRTMGTAAGIDRFCNGDIDLAAAIRPMTGEEDLICGANDVATSELLIGHHIVAFVANPDAPAACLTNSQLEAALKPSSNNLVLDWSFVDAESAEIPLTLFSPRDDTVDYMILDSLIPGDGLRADVTEFEDAIAAIEAVGGGVGSLGFLQWSEALEDSGSIAVLDFDSGDSGNCASPSSENVENGSYSAALPFYLIVNRARLAGNERLLAFLQFVTDEPNASLITAAGAAPPSAASYDMNESLLSDAGWANVDAADFQIPSELAGTITIVGGANAANVLDRAANRLTQANVGLEINLQFAGRANGLAALCAAEADIAMLDAILSDDDLADCAQGEIATARAELGSQATVLLANAADDYASCLTTDEINLVWSAQSAEVIDQWSNVDPSYPNVGITLFGLTSLDQLTDILLQTAGAVIPPIRRDTEKDFDPLYRAAAVANVPGALTYMRWHDYQRVLDNDQANVTLVAVDAGAGCVEPSPATIADGSYALSRPATLLIRRQSMSGVSTQSYLWTLFDAENWPAVEREGFVGVSALDLAGIRLDLQRSFAEAEAMYPAPDDADETAEDTGAEGDEGDDE